MGLFKKKEKEPEVFYDSKISFDGGLTFCTAEEAMPIIEHYGLWDKIFRTFDSNLWSKATSDFKIWGNLSHLKRYLQLSPQNLVFGRQKDVIVIKGNFDFESYIPSIDDFDEISFFKSEYYLNNIALIITCGGFFDGEKRNRIKNGELPPAATIGGAVDDYEFLRNMPVYKCGGAKARIAPYGDLRKGQLLSPRDMYFEPGEILETRGMKFFIFGGGFPLDCFKDIDTPEKIIGPDITEETIEKAKRKLDEYNWDVDYVLTYYAPNNIHTSLAPQFYKPNIITNFFDELQYKLTYRHWYAGAYRLDRDFENSITAICSKTVFLNGMPKAYNEFSILPK